jgi:hypothetical protein
MSPGKLSPTQHQVREGAALVVLLLGVVERVDWEDKR